MRPPSAESLDALGRLITLGRSEIEVGVAAALARAYQSFQVPKGNGRSRRLDVPAPELRRLQRFLLHDLLSRAPLSPFAHGFAPGRSIVTNARVHVATARSLLSLDLEDAYPSVSRDRVRAVLEWFVGPQIKSALPTQSKAQRGQVCDLVADLCCFRDALPQGAPTSGALLNLVCARLDRLCAQLLRRYRSAIPDLRYSRYADDLSFTTSAELPKVFTAEAATAILRSGFRPNRRKTRLSSAEGGDLVICGIRLHQGELGLPRKQIRRYRSLFHRVLALEPASVPIELRQVVNGTLGFLTMVTPECPAMLEGPLTSLLARHASWLPAARTGFKPLSPWQYGP